MSGKMPKAMVVAVLLALMLSTISPTPTVPPLLLTEEFGTTAS